MIFYLSLIWLSDFSDFIHSFFDGSEQKQEIFVIKDGFLFQAFFFKQILHPLLRNPIVNYYNHFKHLTWKMKNDGTQGYLLDIIFIKSFKEKSTHFVFAAGKVRFFNFDGHYIKFYDIFPLIIIIIIIKNIEYHHLYLNQIKPLSLNYFSYFSSIFRPASCYLAMASSRYYLVLN